MENTINTFRQLYYTCKQTKKTIYEAAIDYEVSLGEYTEYRIRLQAKRSLDAMKSAIKEGMKSTEPSPSGMSGDDCNKLQKRFTFGNSIMSPTLQKIMVYALATSEQNLRMGIIAA